MDVPANFNALLLKNKGKQRCLDYAVPEMHDDSLRYFANNLNSICDQIHTLIREASNIDGENSRWKFMEYLSTKGKKSNLSEFITILKEVETNFSSIVSTDS